MNLEQKSKLIQALVLKGITQKSLASDIGVSTQFYRVYHHENEFSKSKSHVNGIESFWSFAKRRISKFNGLTDEKFILHLKES